MFTQDSEIDRWEARGFFDGYFDSVAAYGPPLWETVLLCEPDLFDVFSDMPVRYYQEG